MSDAVSFVLGLIGTALLGVALFAMVRDSIGASFTFFALGLGVMAIAAKGR